MASHSNQISILRAYYVNVLYEHRKCLKEWLVKSVPNTLQQQKKVGSKKVKSKNHSTVITASQKITLPRHTVTKMASHPN